MSSKSQQAKQFARTFRLRHAEAVAILREDVEFVEQLFDALEISMDQARAMVVADYPLARKRADERAISFRSALAQIRDEQARQRRFGNAAASFPTLEQLLWRALEGTCEGLIDEPIHRDGDDDLEVEGLNFDGIEVPDDVDEITIDYVNPDETMLIWNYHDTLEGETEIGTVEVPAEVTFGGYMQRSDTYRESEVRVTDADWNDHVSQVAFDRQVILEFEATVIVGAEHVELTFLGAKASITG